MSNPTIWRNNDQYWKTDPRRYVDLGITEAFAGGRRTDQGGSEFSTVWGKSNVNNPQSDRSRQAPDVARRNSGSVLGDFSSFETTNSSPVNRSDISDFQTPDQPDIRDSGGGGDRGGSPVVDLSNPVKKDEWARANGYDGWNHYQTVKDERKRHLDNTFNEINTGFDQYESNLRGMITDHERERDESMDSASKTYEHIFEGLDEQKQSNLDKLNANRSQVGDRRKSSIKDLQQNLARTVRGVSMQMGALGAGDTSATQVMMPYAYTKIAGQQEGGIHKQANQQLFEIDQQEADTKTQFAQLWRDTEIEKENQLQSIKDNYGHMIRQVRTALTNAPRDKHAALAELSRSLLQEASGKLAALEQNMIQRRQGIQDWARERLASLNNAKLELAGNANFNPRDIVFNEMSAGGVPESTKPMAAEVDWNPMQIAQKRREEFFA